MSYFEKNIYLPTSLPIKIPSQPELITNISKFIINSIYLIKLQFFDSLYNIYID